MDSDNYIHLRFFPVKNNTGSCSSPYNNYRSSGTGAFDLICLPQAPICAYNTFCSNNIRSCKTILRSFFTFYNTIAAARSALKLFLRKLGGMLNLVIHKFLLYLPDNSQYAVPPLNASRRQ